MANKEQQNYFAPGDALNWQKLVLEKWRIVPAFHTCTYFLVF